MTILTITLAIAVIALAVALIIKSKEYNDLLDKYSDGGKLICKLKNELNTLTVENVRLTGENRDYFVEKMKQNLYHEFHKFVLVSDELSNYMEQMPKRYEEDGYIYDKDKSFQTVLCFTKRVPTIKDEPKDEQRKEGLPDWMYEDDEPDKLTKAKNEEKERITMEIMECNGDKLRAAKHLGYDINTFLQKIVEYNIH
jgi:DNA-binding NtrC family response regulator